MGCLHTMLKCNIFYMLHIYTGWYWDWEGTHSIPWKYQTMERAKKIFIYINSVLIVYHNTNVLSLQRSVSVSFILDHFFRLGYQRFERFLYCFTQQSMVHDTGFLCHRLLAVKLMDGSLFCMHWLKRQRTRKLKWLLADFFFWKKKRNWQVHHKDIFL